MNTRQKTKVFLYGTAILMGGVLILLRNGLSFWYFALALAVVVVTAFVWDRNRPRSAMPARKPDLVAFRRGLGKSQSIPGLDLQARLVFNSESQTASARITNSGTTPLDLDGAQVSLAYSNVLGRPARSGNSLDGVFLTPEPIIPSLAPGETREIEVFGPNRRLEIASQHLTPSNQKIADEILAAGSLLEFLKRDTTGAFHILFTVGSSAHEAVLPASDLQTLRD